jgi:hypothetical protein
MKAGILFYVAILAVGCSDDRAATPSGPTPSGGSGSSELTITGDPTSPQGATWSYRGTLQGTVVDLQGVLRNPRAQARFQPSSSAMAPASRVDVGRSFARRSGCR